MTQKVHAQLAGPWVNQEAHLIPEMNPTTHMILRQSTLYKVVHRREIRKVPFGPTSICLGQSSGL